MERLLIKLYGNGMLNYALVINSQVSVMPWKTSKNSIMSATYLPFISRLKYFDILTILGFSSVPILRSSTPASIGIIVGLYMQHLHGKKAPLRVLGLLELSYPSAIVPLIWLHAFPNHLHKTDHKFEN